AICGAPAYLARRQRPQTMEALSEHACIRFGREGRIVAWQLASPGCGTRSVMPAGRLIMGHGEAVLDAALAGHGLAYLPTWLIREELKHGALDMGLAESALEELDVHALWPRTRVLAPKIRVVVDELLHRFQPPPWDAV